MSVNHVIVSGRVRLARNYHDLPFAHKQPENALLCISRAREAIDKMSDEYVLLQLNALPQPERVKLMEAHLISHDLLERSAAGAALIRSDRRMSIMINEEDHLRIQAMGTGEDLFGVADEAFRAEDRLASVCPFSFDEQLGYLTACPTNAGTGMRASLMMHLPMVTHYKQMGSVNQYIAKLGLTMRGVYGEGSEALGDLYQVSNQVTLGRTEEEILETVTTVGKKLIDLEVRFRDHFRRESGTEAEDRIWRSYGLLTNARRMDEKEFMQLWSSLRLGAAMELLPVPLSSADALLTEAQSGHAEHFARRNGKNLSVDEARAEIIRRTLRVM